MQCRQSQYDIDLLFNCYQGYCELVPEDVNMAEFIVEEVSAQALVGLFDTVCMGDVRIMFPAESEAPIVIGVRAQGIEPLSNASDMDLLVEDRLTCALLELFEQLDVERCCVR